MLYPLQHYSCAEIVKPESVNGGSCRHGYGRPVVAHWGTSCAYCGKGLAESYDAWLDLSVDHVVPVCASWGKEHPEWIGSLANMVPCCRACNEFLNGYRLGEGRPVPANDDEFLALRYNVLAEKRRKALMRHKQEQQAYAAWVQEIGDQNR